jgi:hypothetical protein
LAGRSVVLGEDETNLRIFPPRRAAWSLRGESAEVLLSGWNAKRVIFGAMHLRTGTGLFLARARDRSADFQAFRAESRRRNAGLSPGGERDDADPRFMESK